MRSSISILILILISLFAGAETLRIQNQKLSHKGLVKASHELSAMSHQQEESESDSDLIAEPPVDDPGFGFFEWMSSPDGIPESYGKN